MNTNNNATNETTVKNEDNLTFPISVGTGNNVVLNYCHPDEAKNPLAFIGKLVKQFAQQILFFADFPKNKQPVTIPAAGNMGEKERALKAQRLYLQAITKGMEQTDEVTDKPLKDVLALYVAKGWKFQTFTKKGILTVADEKVKEVSSSLRLIKAITLSSPELKKLVEGNKNRLSIAKEIDKNGLEAGIKMANEMSFKGLPAIQK